MALTLDAARVALHIADDGIGIQPGDLERTHTHGLVGRVASQEDVTPG